MPRVKLTDRFVSGVTAPRRQNHFDTKITGLNLRVAPSGRKTWLFVYRAPGKAPQWLPLGTYPAVSLADARKAALDQRKALEVDAVDPVAERKATRAAQEAPAPAVFTFADLVELYLTFAKQTKKDWLNDRRKIEKYLRPAWGPLPLREITRRHVHELLDTLVAEGMGTGVNRVQALVSRMFTVALDRSLIDAHPAARMIKRVTERARERTLTDAEIRELWTGLESHPGPAADAVRLRLLLGQRGSEIHTMRWQDLDLEGETWELPGAFTKNARPHTVALPRRAREILVRCRATVPADEPRVFPGLSPASTDYRVLAAIHGGAYEWKDLRRTLATRLAELGFNEATIGRCLNHARYTVTAKHYVQHLYLNETRAAFEAWNDEIQRVLAGKKRRRRVLPFTGAARGR